MTLPLLAAIVATIGDLLLLHVAGAGGSAWRGDEATGTLLAGHYLGVLAIPWYALGYREAARPLPAPFGRAVFLLGAYGAALGAVVHGLTAVLIRVTPVPAGDPNAVFVPQAAFILPLWGLLGLLAVGAAVAWGAGVVRATQVYPRWLALASPFGLALLVSLLALPFAWLRSFVVPASANVAHVLFFALLAWCRPSRAA